MHFSSMVQNEKWGFVILCINFNVVGPQKGWQICIAKYLTESLIGESQTTIVVFYGLQTVIWPIFYRTLIYGMTTIGLLCF